MANEDMQDYSVSDMVLLLVEVCILKEVGEPVRKTHLSFIWRRFPCLLVLQIGLLDP